MKKVSVFYADVCWSFALGDSLCIYLFSSFVFEKQQVAPRKMVFFLIQYSLKQYYGKNLLIYD